MKSISLVMLVICGLSNTISAQIVYEPPAKKLIEFSWSSPFTNEYNNHSELYDSGPFDGISVKPSKEVGGGNIFMVENWKMINEEAKQREYNVVMEIGEKSTLKHNFLVLYGASQMDWFSDEHWNQAEAQLRYLANLAKIGNFKGILWDPEPYKPGKNPWKYEEQLQKDTYSYYDYYVQVRKRGAQFIEAIQDEFPDAVIFSLREFSDYQTGSPFSAGIVPVTDINGSKSSLAEAWWGLHLPFTLGILDKIDENLTFIDGNEDAYFYTSAMEYYTIRNALYNDTRSLIPAGLHRKFAASYALGHAVSTDYIAGNWAGILNAFSYRLSGQGAVLQPTERAMWFEHNMYYALKTSDEYVWLYSEKSNWWTGEQVPEGFADAMKRARNKVTAGESLGFNVESMLEKARDAAEKSEKNK